MAEPAVLKPNSVGAEIVTAIADDSPGWINEVGERDESEDGEEKGDGPEWRTGKGFPDRHGKVEMDFL